MTSDLLRVPKSSPDDSTSLHQQSWSIKALPQSPKVSLGYKITHDPEQLTQLQIMPTRLQYNSTSNQSLFYYAFDTQMIYICFRCSNAS